MVQKAALPPPPFSRLSGHPSPHAMPAAARCSRGRSSLVVLDQVWLGPGGVWVWGAAPQDSHGLPTPSPHAAGGEAGRHRGGLVNIAVPVMRCAGAAEHEPRGGFRCQTGVAHLGTSGVNSS